MISTSKETLSSFEVEASINFPTEKIQNFFASKSIVIKEFNLKEKKETTITYEAVYVATLESMTGLELIKDGDLYQGYDFKLTKLNSTQEYDEIVSKLLEEEKNNKEITYYINYDEILKTNYMKAYGTEGLEYINQDVLKKQRSVMTYMLKKIGSNLLSGKSIMNVSLPIYIFDPRSVLEQMSFGYRYIPLIEKAADASNLERLKYITVFTMAMLTNSIGGTKPFNPILGETFQALIGKNTEVYIEQTSHHPPIMNYYIKNPKFICFGHSEVEINSGANSMLAETKGKLYLKFNDGGLYRFYPPKFLVTGLMLGKRFMNMTESLCVEDITNNLYSIVNFSREQKSFLGKMFGSTPKIFPDYVTGFIANKNDVKFDEKVKIFRPLSNNAILSKFEGEWSNFMKCDNVEYWRNGELEFPTMEKMKFTLPSDSRLRADVILLKNGYEEYAQQAKMSLEEIQRNDKKLRKY